MASRSYWRVAGERTIRSRSTTWPSISRSYRSSVCSSPVAGSNQPEDATRISDPSGELHLPGVVDDSPAGIVLGEVDPGHDQRSARLEVIVEPLHGRRRGSRLDEQLER